MNRRNVSSLAFSQGHEPPRWLQIQLQRDCARQLLDVAVAGRRALGTDAPLAALLEDVDQLPPRELEEFLCWCGLYRRREARTA